MIYGLHDSSIVRKRRLTCCSQSLSSRCIRLPPNLPFPLTFLSRFSSFGALFPVHSSRAVLRSCSLSSSVARSSARSIRIPSASARFFCFSSHPSWTCRSRISPSASCNRFTLRSNFDAFLPPNTNKATRNRCAATRTSVRKAAHRLIAARLADLRRYERALSNGISEEAIHDMRVAAHRLRVALFVFGGRNASKLERKVKRLQDALGEIRDLQVQLGWLEKQKNLADAEGIRMLLAELRATLLDREHDLRTALEEWTGNSAPKLEKRLKKVSGKGRFGGKRMQRELKDWL